MFLMTNRTKSLSEFECHKTLGEGKYKTRRNKYEGGKKAMKICIHATFGNYFWFLPASYIS